MIFSDLIKFSNKVMQVLQRQYLVILICLSIGVAFGLAKKSMSEERYREELLVEVDKSEKKVLIAQINFLDKDGSGDGQFADDLSISKDLAGEIIGLKAENLADTSLNQFNVRYFIQDTSKIHSIDDALSAYLTSKEPSAIVIDRQLFVVPSAGMRSLLVFIIFSLVIGVAIALFRDVRAQKAK